MGEVLMNPDRFHDDDKSLAAYKAGQVDERLDNFDEHFKVVNGSIAKSADALVTLVRVVTAIETKVKIAGYITGVFLTAWVSAIAYLLVHSYH